MGVGGCGCEVKVMVFSNHSPWQAGYVDDVPDVRVEKADFPPASFIQ